MTKNIPALFVLALLAACTSPRSEDVQGNGISERPSKLYHNGTIITMEGDGPNMVEAVVEQDGKIAFVGSLADAEKAFPTAQSVDLQQRTLLPGFIDPHSHFGMVSNSMGQVDLNPPPVGDVTSIPEAMEKIKKFKTDHAIPDGEWIFGWGYDESQMAELRHPNKTEVDAVLPNNPVYLQHTRGHMGVANSAALKLMNVSAATADPAGGSIGRMPDSKEPNGLVQETAMYPLVGNMMQLLAAKQGQYFDKTQAYYAEHGITTAQDGMLFSGRSTWEALRFLWSPHC